MIKNWQQYGDCTGVDPELFYPVSETSAVGLLQVAVVRGVCSQCPVRAYCLRDAIDREGGTPPNRRYGIWGGYTTTERFRIYRRLTRRRAAAERSAAA